MPGGRIACRNDRRRVVEEVALDVLEQSAAVAGPAVVRVEQPLEVREQAAVEQGAAEDVAEAAHHIRRGDVGQPERHEDHGPRARAADGDPEALQRLEEVERHEPVGRGVAHRANGRRGRRLGVDVHHAERPAPQRLAHPLGPLPDHLHGVGRRRLQPGLEQRQGVELQLGPQRRRQVAEHRAAHHAGENLERALPRLGFPAPAPVEHREAGLVAGREGHAVEQLPPQYAERLPVFLDLDERPIAHRRRGVRGNREEVGHAVAARRSRRRALREQHEPLEVEHMPGHVVRLGAARGRGRRRLEITLAHVPSPTTRRRQPARRRERDRLVAERRRVELDRILGAEPDPQSQLRHVAPWDRDGPVRLAHPVASGVSGGLEHRHGHALCGFARVLMHDPEDPDLLHAGCHAAEQGGTNMQFEGGGEQQSRGRSRTQCTLSPCDGVTSGRTRARSPCPARRPARSGNRNRSAE